MTFYAHYPDLEGLSTEGQLEELYNKFIALSRQVEYAVNHIDHKNMTPTFNKIMEDDRGNISKLQQTAKDIISTVENKADISQLTQTAENITAMVGNKVDNTAAYYQFGSQALTIYSAGIKIRKGTPENPGEQVFYADNEGNLTLKNINVDTATMKNITISNGGFEILDSGGKRVFGFNTQGNFDMRSITLYDKEIICGTLVAYANDTTWLNLPSLTLAAGDYGHSYIGSPPPQEDNGLVICSGYKRTISGETGVPNHSEKQQHSGISLEGDVVINNFNDDYYRYPVIGDANYKTRLYMGDGAIKFALFNPKTNAVVNTYTLIPDRVD